MPQNPLLLKGFTSGWIQKFFTQPFDPINVMLAMRSKLMLDAIDELGKSYNLLRGLGYGWIDLGEIPGEDPGDPRNYFSPALQGNIGIDYPYVSPEDAELARLAAAEAAGPAPEDAEAAQAALEAGALQALEAAEAAAELRRLAAIETGTQEALDAEAQQAIDEAGALQALGNLLEEAELAKLEDLEAATPETQNEEALQGTAEGGALSTTGGGAPGGGVTGIAGEAGTGFASDSQSLAAPWGFLDQGIATGQPGYSGNNSGGWNCCMDENTPTTEVTIEYTTLDMVTGEVQELSVFGAAAACPEDIYEWSVVSGGGELDAIAGKIVNFTAPAGGAGCVSEQVIILYCNAVQVDAITIIVETCPAGAAIGYTSQQMTVNGTQTLSAVPVGDPACGTVYDWAITAGGGTLSAPTGDSVIYTAPATNAECANNPTIQLSCNGTVLDSLQLAVNAGPTSFRAYRHVRGCKKPCGYYPGEDWCGKTFGIFPGTNGLACSDPTYRCDGTFYDYQNLFTGENLTPANCNTFYNANCGTAPSITDLRTAPQKTAGCCPAGLL